MGYAPPEPPPPPPMAVLKEEDFYYDNNNDSDYSKSTDEIELYPDAAGKGVYDDDIVGDFVDIKEQKESKEPKKKPGRKVSSSKKLAPKSPQPEKKEKNDKTEKSDKNDKVEKTEKIVEFVPEGPVSYVWFHNGSELAANESRRYVLADGTLFFKKFGSRRGQRGGLQDSGQYRCLAVGLHGAMLSTALTVNFAGMGREFTFFPADREVLEGDAFQFSCEIQSNPPANITWERNYKSLPDSKRYYILTSGALLITNAQKEDSGDYRCVAVNSFLNRTRHSPIGSVAVVKSMLPSYPLTFVSEIESADHLQNETTSAEIRTKDISVYYGSNVSLGCAVSGKPKPKVVWNFQSDSLDIQAKEISSMEVFRIMSIKEEHSGLYTCIATNEQQSIQQAYRVSVLLAPYLKQAPTSEHTPTAKTVRFNCSAGGSPPPRISWYKDGRPLNITGRLKLKSQDKRPPELIVSDTISSDRGIYQCIASNVAGEASGWALLAVRALNVPPPSFVRCRPVSRDTVRITWEAPLRLPAVAYTVHFMLADGGEEHSQILTSKMYDLKKLDPFRSYEFYTKTYTNRRGASDQSPHVVCHGQGVHIHLSSVGNSSMHVSWRENAPNVRIWQLQWRAMGPNSTIHNITLPRNISSYLVQDVNPLDRHEFRLLASPSERWLPQDLGLILWSSAANATILPYGKSSSPRGHLPIGPRLEEQDQPSTRGQPEWLPGGTVWALRPTALAASATGPRSVNVSWSCDAAEASPDGYYFVLCYMQRHEGRNISGPVSAHKYRERCVQSLNNWMEIMGLEPGTLYGFKVQAMMQNQLKGGPFSEIIVCRTKHEVSNSVTDVRWELLEGGVVQISWVLNKVYSDPAAEGAGEGGEAEDQAPVMYTVYYSHDPLAPLPKWSSKNVTNATQLELHDVNTDSACYVMVSLRGEERGRVIAIPPHPTPVRPGPAPSVDSAISLDQNLGILVGVILSLMCVVTFVLIVTWQHWKVRVGRQGAQPSQVRSNRIVKSDFECQELMEQPSHIDSKGGVVYVKGVESEVTVRGEVGEPLLNGHVRITENPRFSKKHVPNGNCLQVAGKKSTGPVFDGTFDLSRYELFPDLTAETFLFDATLDTSAEQVDALSSEGLPEVRSGHRNSDSDTAPVLQIANGVQVHIDRNSNSEVTNIKKVKESLNNDIAESDKIIKLDPKFGTVNYIENEKQDVNSEKCLLNKSGPNTKLENAKNNSSEVAVTLDYRENGARRPAPALGPNG